MGNYYYLCSVINKLRNMVLTLDFIAEKFAEFNEKYFNGELDTPEFKITHVKSYLGLYHYKYERYGYGLVESVISISDMFDRSETDVCNTIIHEMIHLYIRQNHIKDTRPHHGRVFNSIADRINRQGGWHIARTDSIAGCGLKEKPKDVKFYIACFFDSKGKYFHFRMNEKYLDYYKDKFDLYPNHYKNVFVFVSSDDKKYAHFAACHSGVRGYYISKEEFDSLRANENVIYAVQTLGINHRAA